jgi:type VI secretion system protein ImpE
MSSEARTLYDSGQLEAAIESLIGSVKANPGDTLQRTFLFELLCFAGQWDRAEKQLDVIGHQSAQAELGVLVYRNNIKAERERARLFSDGTPPHFLNEPPPYVDFLVEGIRKAASGDLAGARESLDRAEEDRPAISGRINGQPFSDFREYDDSVGGVLELIVKDRYAWLPFEQMKRFEISPPKKLRELLWAEARVEALDGTVGEVYVPVLYEGSSKEESPQLRLGRSTEWKELGSDVFRARGMRLFLIDDQDRTLFETLEVEFDPVVREQVTTESESVS